MKLNSSRKALLWEELYVGGSIFGVVLGMCIFVAISFRIFVPIFLVDWKDVDISLYLTVYAISILLLLQIGNSGEMHIGFPHRIFHLPITLSLIVTVSLFTRLFLVILSTFLLRFVVAFILSEYVPYELSTHRYMDAFQNFSLLNFLFMCL
ncbi:MAG: hypothetical protein ACP5UA_01400 [Candidatus Hydrogenedens sp.]